MPSLRGTVEEVPDELTATKISDFINELPGYSAQVLPLWVYDRLLDRHCCHRYWDLYLCLDYAEI